MAQSSGSCRYGYSTVFDVILEFVFGLVAVVSGSGVGLAGSSFRKNHFSVFSLGFLCWSLDTGIYRFGGRVLGFGL